MTGKKNDQLTSEASRPDCTDFILCRSELSRALFNLLRKDIGHNKPAIFPP
jgi:hypothetical protein